MSDKDIPEGQSLALNQPLSKHEEKIGITEDKKLVEEYDKLFGSFVSRPSFREVVGQPSLETLSSAVDQYKERTTSILDSLEAIRDEVDKKSGKYTETDLYAAEDLVLNDILGSSEAAEVRMFFFGLKPAIQSNVGGEYREKMRINAPNIKVEDYYPLALIGGINDTHIVNINYGSDEKPRVYDIAYSPKLVKQVMEEYKDVFSAFGYVDASTETIDRAFKDSNPVIRSLLLGYPLGSAMFHDSTLEELSRLPLSDEQKEFLVKVFDSKEKHEAIENQVTGLYFQDEKNQDLQDLWIKSGLDSFLTDVAKKYASVLGIKPEEMRTGWL